MNKSGGWKAQSSFRFQNLYALKHLAEHALEDLEAGLRFERILLEQPLSALPSIKDDEREVDFILEFFDKQKKETVREIYEVKSTETDCGELKKTLRKFYEVITEGVCTLIIAKNAPGSIIKLTQDLKNFQRLRSGARKIKEISKTLGWSDDEVRKIFGGEESFTEYLRNVRIEWGEKYPDALVDQYLSEAAYNGRMELDGPTGFQAKEIKDLLLTELEAASILPDHTSRHFTRVRFFDCLANYSVKNHAIIEGKRFSLAEFEEQKNIYYSQISGERGHPTVAIPQIISARASIETQDEQND